MEFRTLYLQMLKKQLLNTIGGSILLGFFIGVTFYRQSGEPLETLIYCLHSSIISFLLWLGNLSLIEYLNHRFSWLTQLKRRVIWGIVGSFFYTVLAFILLQIPLLKWLHGYTIAQTIAEFNTNNVLLPIIVTAFITIFVHSVAFFQRWQQAELEKENLQREQLASNFEALKNQVNPHFLFNSLNALTTLVHKDPDLAVQFIQQLSKAYRYVLDTQTKPTVPLSTEIAAVESYIFLLKIRFADSLQIHLDLPKSESLFIVPLALQMLVENAIKHNVASKSKPLTIAIFVKKDWIVIQNNLQPKNTVNEKSGIGLNNLRTQYQILVKKEIKIEKTTSDFIVQIPLIA